MKTFISLFVSSVLLITQTLAVSYATEKQGTANLYSSKDMRLKLADEIEAKGAYLQNIADTQGVEVAHQEFERMAQANLTTFFAKSRQTVQSMTEGEAKAHLEKVQKGLATYSPSAETSILDVEQALSILSDRSKTAKEKVTELYANQSYAHFQTEIQKIEEEVSQVGYQKAFGGLANQMRDRSHDDSYDDGDNVFLVLVLIILVAVVILAIVSPQPTYYVVGSGCGGYVGYHYYSRPYNHGYYQGGHYYHN